MFLDPYLTFQHGTRVTNPVFGPNPSFPKCEGNLNGFAIPA